MVKAVYGTTRFVILTKWVVFKFPRTCSWRSLYKGLLANLQEHRIWHEKEADPRLCPVWFCLWGGWLLLMPRARMLSLKEWNQLDLDEYRDLPIDYGLANFGWHKNRVVSVDYGGQSRGS